MTKSESPENGDPLHNKSIGQGERSAWENHSPEREQEGSGDLDRFRALLDQAGDAIFIIQFPSGRIEDVTESACRQLGYSRQELLSKSIQDLLIADARVWINELLNGSQEASYRRPFNTALSKRDGAAMQVEMTISRATVGEAVFGVAVARDIAGRKPMEEALPQALDIAQQTLADATLRESEERYRLLVELSPDAIAIHRGGEIVFVNSATAKLLGAASPQELVGRQILDLVHPDYRGRVGERVRQMREGKTVPLIEEKFLRLDGTAVDVEVVATPFTYHGQPAIQVVAHDITARKQAEAALRESEERYRALAEAAHDMIFIVDPTGCVQYVNSFSAEQFGCLPEALAGKPLGELFPSTTSERQKQSLRQVFETGTPRYVETQTTFPNCQLWMGTWLVPLKNEAGHVATVLGISRDITERVLTEEALRQSELKFRGITENSEDGISLTDVQGMVIEWNRGQEQITGLKADEVLGRPMWDVQFRLSLEERRTLALYAQLKTLILQLLQTGQVPPSEAGGEWPIQLADGTRRTIQTTVFAIKTDQGLMLGGITRDTTTRKQAEEALRRQNEYLTALQQTTLELVSQLDLDNLLQNIVKRAGQLIGTSSGFIDLVEPGTTQLQPKVGLGTLAESLKFPVKPGEGLAGIVWKTGQPLVIEDYDAWPGRIENFGRNTIYSIVGVPLLAGTQVLGVLGLAHDAAVTPPQSFGQADVELLTQFAQLATVAVENARLFEAARQHVAELEAVRQASLSLTSSLDLPAVLDAIAESTIKLLREADNVHIYLYQADRLVFGTVLWSDGRQRQPYAEPRPDGLTYSVARHGQLIVVPNSRRHPLYANTFLDWEGAIVALPLKIGPRVVGVMNVGYQHPRDFPETELRALRLLADQAALAVENARLYQEVYRHASELGALIEIGRDLSATLDLRTVLERIAAHARDLLEADDSEVYLIEPDGQTLRAIVALGDYSNEIKAATLRLGKGIVGSVAQSGIAEVVSSVAQDPRIMHVPGTPVEDHALMCAPLISKDKVIGVMALTRLIEQKLFNQSDLNYLIGLARQATIAIENARLYEEVRRRAGKLSALIEISRDILGTLDLPVVLERIATHARDVLEADDSEVYLLEPDGQTLRAIVALGIYAEEIKVSPARLGQGIVGFVGRSGVAEVVNDINQDPRSRHIDGTPDESHALMCAPLISKGQVIGVMALTRYVEQGPFSQADLDFFTGLARQAALAIENARLYEEVRLRAGKLSALIEIGRDISGTLDLPVALERIAAHARDLLEADDSEVYLLEPDGRTLRAIVALGQYAEEIKATTRQLGEGIVGSITQKGVVEVVNHVANDPRGKQVPGTPVEDHALMVAPLTSKGQVIGAMALTRYVEQRPFSQADVDFMTGLARQAAIAIENARLYATEQQRTLELGHALEQQKELDRLKNQFIQNVSHELRTPLAIIRGYAELLEAGELGALGPEQQEPIKVISRRVRMLGNLVDNLTAIIKVETSEVEKEPVDLAEMARAMLADFRVVAEKAGLTLTVQVAPDLPFVSGDVTQLRRVLDNLLGNALKFTPTGGTLGVRLEQEGAQLILQVSDTGIGIPADKLGRIFERFYQVDGSMTRRYSGVGLGLALVKEIVQAHGGTVSVTSVQGQGSTFRVALPIYVNSPSPSP